jgi:hypothetical protein
MNAKSGAQLAPPDNTKPQRSWSFPRISRAGRTVSASRVVVGTRRCPRQLVLVQIYLGFDIGSRRRLVIFAKSTHQVTEAYQVVRRCRGGEHPAHSLQSAMPKLPHKPDAFHFRGLQHRGGNLGCSWTFQEGVERPYETRRQGMASSSCFGLHSCRVVELRLKFLFP